MDIEVTGAVAASDLPLAELADFLQLQTSSTGYVRQNQQLEMVLRGAITEIETRTRRVLLRQGFAVYGENQNAFALPFVRADQPALVGVERNGSALAAHDFSLIWRGDHALLHANTTPSAGSYRFLIEAGAAHWSSVPADLQLAVIALSAHYYRTRFQDADGASAKLETPMVIRNLIEKYRPLRVG